MVLGVLGAVVSIVNMKTGRDDLRQKAEVNYVTQLEGRLTRSEEREADCENRYNAVLSEVSRLRSELLEALRGNRTSRRRGTPPGE